ncbi:unnamed protein product [Peronospora belbahrii]|uniref:RING-type domain-containing protein n=1 Tax=Peronospora belbahrii TaxID=622444 RepID=A0ABN8CTD0_9STRA|nr:unnamed protein product [Peronospora belbahrii]
MDDDSRMSETSSVRNRGQRRASSTIGDLDGAGDVSTPSGSHIRPQLRCNACWEPILPDAQSAETCYRTSCGHLFCEKCAYKHFGQGRLECPACRVDLSQARRGISETTIHGIADAKRTEAIWEEMMADPSSCFEHFQQALDFILFQLAQDSYRQVNEETRRQQAEEQKTFQIQHGEKYIQLKSYTDQLEAELRETKAKMQALTTSNDELREAYKEKSRKCRNWEKMCKTLKSQSSNVRQFPSPTRSTMGMMHQGEGGALVTQASQFSRPSMRPMARPYMGDTSNSSTSRNPMMSMGRPETPRAIQRPNIGMFDRFSRPQIGGSSRSSVQPMGGSRAQIMRPKTPLHASQRVGFLSKRPTFRM